MTAALDAFREHDVVDLPNAFRGTVLSTEGTTARIATIGSPTTTLWRFADLRLYHRPAPFVEIQVPPTATQEIESAIDKLAALRSGSAVGPWHAFGSGPANGDHWYVFDHDEEMVVQVSSQDGSNEDERQPNADLIVTLHRTIEVQIGMLESSRLSIDQVGSPRTDTLALARAINGDS